jgi:indole-3-acetate monooxygenase
MKSALLSAAQEGVALLSGSSQQHETERHLSEQTVAFLKSLDILRAYVPRNYGGPEHDPISVISTIQALSAADGASGWCATIASLTSHIAGCLEPATAQLVFGSRDSVVCGAYAPSGRAAVTPDGYDVSGRWAWGSGLSLATWMTGGTICDDRSARHMFFPRSAVTVHDTWKSSGLRGTASHDFSVETLRVDRDLSVDLAKPQVQVDAPVSRMPLFVLFSGGVAAVMLGIADRAIDELRQLATLKKPAQSSKPLAESQVAQIDIARAEALVRSAQSYLHDIVNQAWECVLNGDRVPTELRVQARLAATLAGEQACAAVDLCYKAGGGTAVYETSPLQRCFRDVHTAAAHIMVSTRTYESVGRLRFGLSIDPSVF